MPKIYIEVVLALKEIQHLLRFEVNTGTTIQEALGQTDLIDKYPEYFQQPVSLGIFGNIVAEDYILQNEDRIEIYRPLKVDPKQNRRIRSEKKNG